jgi:aryl-alcohol dehydrogenase-like predicted oxidoreductase
MNSDQISRISLGTANFFKSYGVINALAIPSDEINKIAKIMSKFEITKIDTALSYSASSTECSKWEKDFFRNRDISTKFAIKNFKIGSSVSEMINIFKNDLDRKNLTRYRNVLVHDFFDLQPKKVNLTLEVLEKLKSFDLTEQIGFSAYNSTEIDVALKLFRPDVIQVPLNIFDQRLINSGHLDMMMKKGIKIQARSIFLQGLLLSKLESIPPKLNSVTHILQSWWEYIDSESLNPLELCLGFVSGITSISEFIIGVNNSTQLQLVLDCELADKQIDYMQFASLNEILLDPRKW